MAKLLQGKVISVNMKNTVVVSVMERKPHPLYRKLLTRSKNYKVETNGKVLELGKIVQILETRPLSGGKHFVLKEEKK